MRKRIFSFLLMCGLISSSLMPVYASEQSELMASDFAAEDESVFDATGLNTFDSELPADQNTIQEDITAQEDILELDEADDGEITYISDITDEMEEIIEEESFADIVTKDDDSNIPSEEPLEEIVSVDDDMELSPEETADANLPKTVKLKTTKYIYDGKVKTPGLTITDNKGKKIASKYYSVKYQSGRKKVGKYYVKVTFKGSTYSGTKTLYFTIVPKAGSMINKLEPGRGSVTVNVKKYTTQTDGYEVQYSKYSNMKDAGIADIAFAGVTTTTIDNLEGKTKYYFRVRTYKIVNGVTYYSTWSQKVSCTTLKVYPLKGTINGVRTQMRVSNICVTPTKYIYTTEYRGLYDSLGHANPSFSTSGHELGYNPYDGKVYLATHYNSDYRIYIVNDDLTLTEVCKEIVNNTYDYSHNDERKLIFTSSGQMIYGDTVFNMNPWSFQYRLPTQYVIQYKGKLYGRKYGDHNYYKLDDYGNLTTELLAKYENNVYCYDNDGLYYLDFKRGIITRNDPDNNNQMMDYVQTFANPYAHTNVPMGHYGNLFVYADNSNYMLYTVTYVDD